MIRQTIVDSVISKLEQIRKENGYYSDAGLNVYEWRLKPLEDKNLPALIVQDPESSAIDKQQIQHTLTLYIDIAVVAGKDDVHRELREIISDVLKALGEFEQEQHYITRYIKNEKLLEHHEVAYAGGTRIEIEIDYNTQRWAH